MKTCLKLAGLGAVAATALQAEVKINESLALDGYAIGAGVVTEGTLPDNGPEFGKSAFFYDSVFVGLTGSYNDFTARVSLFNVVSSANAGSGVEGDAGVLDAYVTYKTGNIAITGGQYLGYLGFESFHSVNNAFISFSQAAYRSPWATGAKIDYTGEGFSTGFSVRDSQISQTGSFFNGDGEFSNDLGYEAYVMLTSVENLTVFAGAGFEDVDGGSSAYTFDLWASYKISETLSFAAEYASIEDIAEFTWLTQLTYTASEELAVSGRLTGADNKTGADALGYGVASTYTLSPNFAVKGEATITDFDGGSDVFSYALQGIFKF
jgi:hypothetical protein